MGRGPLWLASCLAMPALGWIAGTSRVVPLYLWNWHWRLAARVVLAAAPALFAGRFAIKLLRGREWTLLVCVAVATFAAAASGWPALRDLSAGVSRGEATIARIERHSLLRSGPRAPANFVVQLADGRQLRYDGTVGRWHGVGETIRIVSLDKSGEIVGFEGELLPPEHEPFEGSAFWIPVPVLAVLVGSGWLLRRRFPNGAWMTMIIAAGAILVFVVPAVLGTHWPWLGR